MTGFRSTFRIARSLALSIAALAVLAFGATPAQALTPEAGNGVLAPLTSFTAAGVSDEAVQLTFGFPSDASWTTPPEFYRDGVKLESVFDNRGSFLATGLRPSTTYHFQVLRRSILNGDTSPAIDLTVTTAAAGTDGIAPEAPQAEAVETADAVYLTITRPSDDKGVAGYEILRGGSVVRTLNGGTQTALRGAIADLAGYDWGVRAFDAAGNRSPESWLVIEGYDVDEAATSRVYRCNFPGAPNVPVTARYEDLPRGTASSDVGKGRSTVSAFFELGDASAVALQAAGAATLEGGVEADVRLANGVDTPTKHLLRGSMAAQPLGGVDQRFVAAKITDFFPYLPHGRESTLSAGAVAFTFKARKADGTIVRLGGADADGDPDTFSVDCTLAAGEDQVISSVFISLPIASPPRPVGVTIVDRSDSVVRLQWSEPTIAYEGALGDRPRTPVFDIYRNGTLVETVGPSIPMPYTVTGLSPAATSSITIAYRDAGTTPPSRGYGPVWAQSTIEVATLPVGGDEIKPTTPGVTTSWFDGAPYASWTAAQDNRGVTGYEIVWNGEVLATTTKTWARLTLPPEYAETGLKIGWYEVRAFDAAGNRSEPGRASAFEAPAAKSLQYQCTVPGAGSFPVRAEVSSTLPASIWFGASGRLAAIADLSGGASALAAIGAAKVGATSTANGRLRRSSTSQALTFRGAMASRALDDADGALLSGDDGFVVATGETGPAQLTFDALSLNLRPQGGDGAAISLGSGTDSDGDPATVDVPCTLSPPTQDTTVATTQIVSATPTPTPRPTPTPIPGKPTPTIKPMATPTPTPRVTPTPTPIKPTPTLPPEEDEVPFTYSAIGTATLKTLTKGSLPLSGSLALRAWLSSGNVTGGELALNPASGNLTALGFLPVTAKVTLVQTEKVTGALNSGKLTLAAKVRIKLPSVKTLGIELAGGANCQAKQVTAITLTSTQPDYRFVAGGPVAGTFAISDLTGCGFLTGLVSPLTKGSGNAVALNLTPAPVR